MKGLNSKEEIFKLPVIFSCATCVFQRPEAMKLVRDAVAAGIFNDLGSGSNVDLCIITKDKVDYLRPYDEANVKGKR